MCCVCKEYGKHQGHKVVQNMLKTNIRYPHPKRNPHPQLSFQHAVLETEANQIRASILDMAHCIRTFTDEVSEYSRKLVGIVQLIEGGEQIVEDGIGMAHTEHVRQRAAFSNMSHLASFRDIYVFLWIFHQVPGTAESARSCVRAYFADLHETLCRQEEMALSVVDAHVRERLIWLRQQQEDMTILLSQVSTACLHCEKTLQQVGSTTTFLSGQELSIQSRVGVQ